MIVAAKGTTLKIGAVGATADTYAAPSQLVGEVLSYDVSGFKQTAIDVTNITDTYKRFRGGQVDTGSLQLELNYDGDDAGYTILAAAARDQTNRSFLINWGGAYSSGTASGTFSFSGVCLVTDVNYSGKSGDEYVKFGCTLKLSGNITEAV